MPFQFLYLLLNTSSLELSASAGSGRHGQMRNVAMLTGSAIFLVPMGRPIEPILWGGRSTGSWLIFDHFASLDNRAQIAICRAVGELAC